MFVVREEHPARTRGYRRLGQRSPTIPRRSTKTTGRNTLFVAGACEGRLLQHVASVPTPRWLSCWERLGLFGPSYGEIPLVCLDEQPTDQKRSPEYPSNHILNTQQKKQILGSNL